MICLLALLAIVLMLFASIWQANWIIRPLQDLKKDIERVGQGERDFTHTYENDEIGQIGQEFQLQLLQSQINPHFLYNTLETLYWMAMSEDAEDVADLTQSLLEIFLTVRLDDLQIIQPASTCANVRRRK